MAERWRTVNLPRDMVDHVERLIQDEDVRKRWGFGTVGEFVRRATSMLIRTVESGTKDARDQDDPAAKG